MADQASFNYLAVDGAGRRVKGVVTAINDTAAFDQLRREGLAPLSLKRGGKAASSAQPTVTPKERESAEFLASLADLLSARADIRTALGILEERSDRPAVKAISQSLMTDIGGGESLERAFARAFTRRMGFVASMVAAGEAAGDLPSGLRRSADIIQSRLKLRDQLISVLAYPGFVLASAVGAVFVMLLFIIPSIGPLVQDMGGTPPLSLRIMIWTSDVVRGNLALLGLGALVAVAVTLLSARLGLLARPWELLTFDGPIRRTVRGLVFGAFSISLGSMLAAGAPISDALRLAARTVSSSAARRRLEPLDQAVRQGQSLSDGLGAVAGFPPSIIRLAAVGEASNTLGEMLLRGGKLEEEAAMRRIETLGRIAGPALIVFLGLILGVLMGGLLSGVSQMGGAALE